MPHASSALINPDVIIVGAGIGGGAMATVLARAGVNVLMLERTDVHKDVVRGEWIAPWGIAETKTLGLYGLYMANGGHHLRRHITFDEDLDPADAAKRAIDLSSLVPSSPGPLCLGHPPMCNLLNEEAQRHGATLLRGVRQTVVTPGTSPTVRFTHDGNQHELKPRLVIAADGRNGTTRQQVGIALHEDPQHHWFSGMLVENVPDWEDDLQCIGTEGDIHALVFPQGGNRVRLYLGFALEQKGRFLGEGGPRAFLDAFKVKSIPNVDTIVRGTPAGPCFVYPNHDTWTEQPFTDGVVLIGDAAGRNDPITGQGLSITHRDVRLLRDLLLGDTHWSVSTFAPYAEERGERMRRLRFAASMTSVREAEFTPEARAKRVRLREATGANPMAFPAPFAAFVGPDALPAEAFSEEAWREFAAV